MGTHLPLRYRNPRFLVRMVHAVEIVVGAQLAGVVRCSPTYNRTWLTLVHGIDHQIDHINSEGKAPGRGGLWFRFIEALAATVAGASSRRASVWFPTPTSAT